MESIKNLSVIVYCENCVLFDVDIRLDPYEYRKRRAVMTEREKESHDHHKVVLLETLGNARMDESYDFIISHINSSNSQWIKRAGCHALRKYEHQHVMIMMLSTQVSVNRSTVRCTRFD